MSTTFTRTSTYTTTDIQKAFQGFQADLSAIAMRTGKWTQAYVNDLSYDVLQLADKGYLRQVDIILLDGAGKPLQVATYTVNEAGAALDGARPGGNNWPRQDNTSLTLMLRYTAKWGELGMTGQQAFERELKNTWSTSSIDGSYPHLRAEDAQLYASNSYELRKRNLK